MKTEKEIRERYEGALMLERCRLEDYTALSKANLHHEAKAHLSKANRLHTEANALEWVLDD